MLSGHSSVLKLYPCKCSDVKLVVLAVGGKTVFGCLIEEVTLMGGL